MSCPTGWTRHADEFYNASLNPDTAPVAMLVPAAIDKSDDNDSSDSRNNTNNDEKRRARYVQGKSWLF